PRGRRVCGRAQRRYLGCTARPMGLRGDSVVRPGASGPADSEPRGGAAILISLIERSIAPPVRSRQPELLELGHGTADEVLANLREMARYNRLLGGLVPLRRHVWPAVEAAARQGRTARVLEA